MREPVRVLYVIDELLRLGGAERALLQLIAALPADRFTPYLLTFQIDRAVFPTLPCPLLHYPMRRIYGWRGVRHGLRLARFLHRERIALVHTFFESSDLWAAPIARLAGNIALISARRDLGIQRSRRQDLIYPLISRLFDEVQAVSEQVREFVIRADRLAPSRVVTIPNSVAEAPPADRAAARQRYGIAEDEPLVVSVGNVRRVKGYDMALRAARRVHEVLPKARFLIAGAVIEPDCMAELQAGLDGRVEFIGAVHPVWDLLAAADAFFLPSRSEGMSNALLEAMSAGLPAVATRVGGNVEVVCEAETGLVVDVDDDTAAAEALVRLLSDADAARAMGEAARQRVREHYSIAAVLRLMLAEYERVLKQRAG
jgi:glycosyltransferase involved in cell wall biosynthesis